MIPVDGAHDRAFVVFFVGRSEEANLRESAAL